MILFPKAVIYTIHCVHGCCVLAIIHKLAADHHSIKNWHIMAQHCVYTVPKRTKTSTKQTHAGMQATHFVEATNTGRQLM